VAGMLVIGIGAFAGLPVLHRPVLRLFGRIGKLKPVVTRIEGVLSTARRLLRPTIFLPMLVLSLVAWACEGVAFHVILGAVGAESDVVTASSVYGLATIAGALSMLPGGIGGTEAVMLILLRRSGVGQPVAVAATELLRASTLWFASFVGFVFFAG